MTTVPAALVWEPANVWLGQDGNWSTWSVTIGSGQQFYVLPSTTNSVVWVPVSEGCDTILSKLPNCTTTRGIGTFNGQQNTGLQTNESSWRQIGIYDLETESSLYGNSETGLFGVDTVELGTIKTTTYNQTVAGIADQDFWIGSVGLANETANFNVVNGDLPALITTLASNNVTPGTAYGFTPGAFYRNSPGNLILGGYDSAAVKFDNISFNIPQGNSLLVNLAGIVATNTNLGTASLLESETGLTMRLDSTITQMWLPRSVCDMMERALGLFYDNVTNIYTINDTMHSKLLSQNPQFTFTLATGPSSSSTTNVVLPYAAFDLTIGLPTFDQNHHYFPIKRAANESQYVLGRAFMQEAYMIVDWERGYFHVGQAQHTTSAQQKIVTIQSPQYESVGSNTSSNSGGGGLSGGAIAGIVVGVVVGVALIAALLFFFLWRGRQKRRAAKPSPADTPAFETVAGKDGFESTDEKRMPEMDGTNAHVSHDPKVAPAELHGASAAQEAMSGQVYELHEGDQSKVGHGSGPVYEMPGSPASQELSSHPIDSQMHSAEPQSTMTGHNES